MTSLLHAFDLKLLHHRLQGCHRDDSHGEHDSEEHDFFSGAYGYGSGGYTGMDFNSMAFTELLHSQSAAMNVAGHVGSSSDQGASHGVHDLIGDEHFADGRGVGGSGRGRGTAASRRGHGAAGGRGIGGARGGRSAAIGDGRGGRASGRSVSGGRPPIPPYCVPRPIADASEYDVDEQGEYVDDVQGHDPSVRLVMFLHVSCVICTTK
jgi:hypothetical protein